MEEHNHKRFKSLPHSLRIAYDFRSNFKIHLNVCRLSSNVLEGTPVITSHNYKLGVKFLEADAQLVFCSPHYQTGIRS